MSNNDRFIEVRESMSNYQWMIEESYRLRERIRNLRDELGPGVDQEEDISFYNKLQSFSPTEEQSNDASSIESKLRQQASLRRMIEQEVRIEKKLNDTYKLMEYTDSLREELIINYRLDGMSIKDIASRVKLSRTHINRIINKVVQRYVDAEKEREVVEISI